MNGRFIVSAIFIIIALACVGVAVYYLYEKPTEEAAQLYFTNVSILVKNEMQEHIITNYSLIVDGLYYNGTTSDGGFALQRIPANSSLSVYITKDGMYSYYRNFNHLEGVQIVRIEETLYDIGNVSLFQEKSIFDSNDIFLNVKSDGDVKYTKMCFRWSTNIVSITPDSAYMSLSDKPERLQFKTDKCYILLENLTRNDFISIPMRISKYNTVTSDDFITVYAIYGDLNPDSTIRYGVKNDTTYTIK